MPTLQDIEVTDSLPLNSGVGSPRNKRINVSLTYLYATYSSSFLFRKSFADFLLKKIKLYIMLLQTWVQLFVPKQR